MKRASFVVFIAVLTLPLVTSATAQPEVTPPEDVAFSGEFEAGFPCAFPVGFEVTGKQGSIVFNGKAIFTAPGLRAELTNLDTGTSAAFVIPGAFIDEELPDGRIRTKAVGRSVLFGLFDGEPGLFLTVGKIVLIWSPDDELNFDLVAEESPGKMIDLCAILAGG